MMRLAMSALRAVGRGVRYTLIGVGALIVSGGLFVYADYLSTVPGSGTSFASKVISTVHYAAFLLCDATAGETQCAAVSAGGAVKVDASSAAVTANPGTASNWGIGATGAAVPANGVFLGLTNAGTLNGWPGDSTNGAFVNIKASSLGLAQGSNTAGQTGQLDMAAVTTTAPSYTTGQTSPLSLDASGGLRIGSQYPAGSTPITASATGTTAATTATLSTGVGVTTYLCGFSIRANATAAATGNATVTGTITGTLNFTQWTAPNASGLGITEMVFQPCVPASTTNTSIAVVSAAPGAGGVVSSTAWGYTRAAQ